MPILDLISSNISKAFLFENKIVFTNIFLLPTLNIICGTPILVSI